MLKEKRQRVVFAPDALGWAVLGGEAKALLELWRDGTITPVVNNDWILRYLRLLHRLGLSKRLIRSWGWWVGSAEHCLRVPDCPERMDGMRLCQHLARESSAGWIVCRKSVSSSRIEQPGLSEHTQVIALSELLALIVKRGGWISSGS